jgi:cysteine-rich repeat protein/predicted outer membrane repeat protein
VEFGKKDDIRTDGGTPVCGNGVLENGEICDATDLGGRTCESAVGHLQGTLRCNEACLLDVSDCSTCGDGVIEGSEQCDDRNTAAADGCSTQCRTEAGWVCGGEPSECNFTCGNGRLDDGEACDDGNTATGDGCGPTCATEPGWSCWGEPTQCAPLCGDGLLVGTEQCDDGNSFNTDGCSQHCTVEPGYTCTGEPSVCETSCGDGLLSPQEGCDDGNTTAADGCSSQCVVEPGWQCQSEPSVCVPICGDGLLAGSEGCDDGNTADDDGCSATCTVEAYHSCANEPSECVCTVYVDIDAVSGNRDGSSWNHAYVKVDSGIEKAASYSACEIWVAEGVYHVYETNSADTLSMRDGISLYGGFAGSETAHAQRNPAVHLTVLDGTAANDPNQQAQHIITVDNRQDVRIDGFTVRNGRKDTPGGTNGGAGLWARYATNLTLANCVFTANTANQGGAVFMDQCTGAIEHCGFNANHAFVLGNNNEDGGALELEDSELTIQSCTFSQNSAFDDGGAIHTSSGTVFLYDCTFTGNSSTHEGGAVAIDDNGTATFDRCWFENNDAELGGAFNTDNSEAVLRSTVFYNNQASHGGGAQSHNGSNDQYLNCVFYGNVATASTDPGGGLQVENSANVTVTNSIFWANNDSQLDVDGANLEMRYSNVQGGHPGLHNLENPPLFVDPSNGDFHLSAFSPCIDAGDGDSAPELDFDENSRVDDPNTDNTGSGTPAYTDIGAFEYQP